MFCDKILIFNFKFLILNLKFKIGFTIILIYKKINYFDRTNPLVG